MSFFGTAFSRLNEFAVSLGKDRRLAAGQLVGGRDLADRAVQADVIVMLDERSDQLPRFLQ
jgi:hypothetical protein